MAYWNLPDTALELILIVVKGMRESGFTVAMPDDPEQALVGIRKLEQTLRPPTAYATPEQIAQVGEDYRSYKREHPNATLSCSELVAALGVSTRDRSLSGHTYHMIRSDPDSKYQVSRGAHVTLPQLTNGHAESPADSSDSSEG